MPIHRLVAVVAMTLLIVLSLLPEYATISEAKSSVVKLNWKVFSNITNMHNFSYSVCETGNYIYMLLKNWKIELRLYIILGLK
jgi:hypothetical protein